MVALGQREKAEQALLYGALLGEPDADTLCNLGAICAHRGQFRLAQLLLQKVLHLQPQHKAALQNLERIRQHKAASKGTSNPLF
jgi:Flp pilus assembly protein TadD